MHIVKLTKVKFGRYLRLLQVFLFPPTHLVLVILYWHFIFILQLFEGRTRIRHFPLVLLVHLPASLSNDWFIEYINRTGQLALSTGTSLMFASKVRLRQIGASLQKAVSRRSALTSGIIVRHRGHLVDTLRTFEPFNRLYGRFFLLYLLVNIPLSLWLSAQLLLHLLSPVSMAFVAFFVAIQFGIIFGLHLYLAQFALRFHAPAQSLLRASGRGVVHRGDTRLSLALSTLIGAFHTTNRYGVRYGHVQGLVTLNSFAKVGPDAG